jgi:hypothetical protein
MIFALGDMLMNIQYLNVKNGPFKEEEMPSHIGSPAKPTGLLNQ